MTKKKKTPTAPKDVQTINVGTSSKVEGKSEKKTSTFPREPSTASMEGIEHAGVVSSTKDREVTSTTPSIEEIKKWEEEDVINFLQEKKKELRLKEEDIEVIRKNRVTGQGFLRLNEAKLMHDGLLRGPAESIAYLIDTLKGEKVSQNLLVSITILHLTTINAILSLDFTSYIGDQTYQTQDHRSLQEIVENAVNKAMKEKPFEVISVSKLSGTKMSKIEKTMGIDNVRLSARDFPDSSTIECDGFNWDMDKDEDKQMQDVKNWFENILKLGEYYFVEDVHKSTKKEVTLDKARTILQCGTDICIGPSLTGCVYVETKKSLQGLLILEESQAKGELLIANANVALDVLIVLTDCNEKWTIFFITKVENPVEQYYIVTAVIDDRGKALSIIKHFVLEQGSKLDNIIGMNKRESSEKIINIEGPLSKKAKFREAVIFCDERMLDMIPDMTEDELFRMKMRWELKMLEKLVRMDEKPIIQQYISAFSDDYENHEPSGLMSMFA
ncbi:4489_t:CDS:2 [Entrophospora sp. SA101]|nr:4489_t:CDS:2 [Entrophospora sp. SA101]CAJ0823111.1 10565_t:CDS:2 [Entrophospora sp. SA101]CAJ0831352.1 4020_t:CDS:2 [Entrophospora sp. SA101]CAJ0892503.1 10176_t:CDS:2 [Entrophospora sp. SA101]